VAAFGGLRILFEPPPAAPVVEPFPLVRKG
jgi:hypothetical protein